MQEFRSIIVILILASNNSFSQSINKTDSLKFLKTVYEVFRIIDSKDKNAFSRISTPKIFCEACLSISLELSQEMNRDTFYSKYLSDITTWKQYEKAKISKDIHFAPGFNTMSDVVVFFNIWMNDNINTRTEHDGIAVGIHLKKVGEVFKFSGIETVP